MFVASTFLCAVHLLNLTDWWFFHRTQYCYIRRCTLAQSGYVWQAHKAENLGGDSQARMCSERGTNINQYTAGWNCSIIRVSRMSNEHKPNVGRKKRTYTRFSPGAWRSHGRTKANRIVYQARIQLFPLPGVSWPFSSSLYYPACIRYLLVLAVSMPAMYSLNVRQRPCHTLGRICLLTSPYTNIKFDPGKNTNPAEN